MNPDLDRGRSEVFRGVNAAVRAFYFDYLAYLYGEDSIVADPGKLHIPQANAIEPHFRVRLSNYPRDVYLVVSAEPYNPLDTPVSRGSHVSTIEKMASLAEYTVKFGGLVVYQQHLRTKAGLALSADMIDAVASNVYSTREAQKKLSDYAVRVPSRELCPGRFINWHTVGDRLREELGMPPRRSI